MNILFQFGWPQVLLLLIGLVGLWLFITAGLYLLSPVTFLSETEKERYRRTGHFPRRRFKVTHGFGGLLLIAVAVSLLWSHLPGLQLYRINRRDRSSAYPGNAQRKCRTLLISAEASKVC